MRIQYFAYLRDCTHKTEDIFTDDVPTIGVLMTKLCQQYGNGFRKWILTPEGELSDIAIVLVNGNDIRHSGRLETSLSPDDHICIFPPVAGG